MIFDDYIHMYLPGTEIFIDSSNPTENNLTYHAVAYKEEEKILCYEHQPKNTLRDIGFVSLSRKRSKTPLYVFGEKYHPAFLDGVSMYLETSVITPYTFREGKNGRVFEKIPQEKPEDTLVERISGIVEEFFEENPHMRHALSVLEKEYK